MVTNIPSSCVHVYVSIVVYIGIGLQLECSEVNIGSGLFTICNNKIIKIAHSIHIFIT